MEFIDLILNLGGLALWVSWRSLGRASQEPSIATHSLMANLRATPPRTGGARWPYLMGLVALLALRSLFYHSVGPTVNWAPAMDFGPVGIAFRSDILWRASVYSFLSFGKFLGVFYLWLLLLSAVNERVPAYDPIQSWVRGHLGVLDELPLAVKAMIPFLIGSLAWATISWGFGLVGMAPPVTDVPLLLKEAAILGVCAYFPLKLPLAAILITHAISSYVYLGAQEWLSYIDTTARNALKPLRWMTLGKVDLAPLVGVALIIYGELYGRALSQRAFGVEQAADESPAKAVGSTEGEGTEAETVSP